MTEAAHAGRGVLITLRRFAGVAQVVCHVAVLAAILAFYVLMDEGWATSLNWQCWAIFTAIGVLASIAPILFGRYRRLAWATVLAYALALAFVSLLDQSPVKPFHRFYRDIQPGMNERQVMAALARRFPAGGRFHIPVAHSAPDGLGFVLDPTRSEYNAEVVLVNMRNGRVTGADYEPD